MANGTLKVQNIQTSSGSGTITLGQSGETIALGSGVTSKFNQPAFEANLSANQSIADNTSVKVQFDTEVFDTDNCYDNSTNYRFTPTVAGKYYVYGQTFLQGSGFTTLRQFTAQLYKNGSAVGYSQNNLNDSEGYALTSTISMVMDMNGSSDYAELYAYFNTNNSSAGTIEGHSTLSKTCFGAYRILGA